MSAPINVTWNGEAFEPVNRFWATKCDQRFVVGQAYTLDEVHARSTATHAHYFAVLHDIWQSLPERMSEKFPTEEHLRKYALIRTGYRTETEHVCKTPAEAERLAAAIRPYDTYQIVTLNDLVVTVYNAISQDMRSMDKQTFQKSKEAVIDFCSELVGIEPAETRRLAGLSNNEASDAPSPSASDEGNGPPQDSATLPNVEPEGDTHSPPPSGFDTTRYKGDDLKILREFAEKGLKEARRSPVKSPAAFQFIDDMYPQYAELLVTVDALTALEKMRAAIDLVIEGERKADRIEAWFNADLLSCEPADLVRETSNG